jgi:RimJ/RimL family protein N-acetyltransferase
MTEAEAMHYMALCISSGMIIPFTVVTREGKNARRAGYIYLVDFDGFSSGIAGVMESKFARGLGRHLRKDKYTYSEDAMRTLIDWCYKKFSQFDRMTSDVAVSNELSLALMKRVGFVKEGVLRHYIRNGDQVEDMVVHSILRKEWQRDLKEVPVNLGSRI